jgi:hypothetical protein
MMLINEQVYVCVCSILLPRLEKCDHGGPIKAEELKDSHFESIAIVC